MIKELYVRGELAEAGMRIQTNQEEPGILKYWREPHKAGSTGRVYITLDHTPDKTREYFPGVIGGKWVDNIDLVYDEIGKDFQDFDFDNTTNPNTPPDWEFVTSSESSNIEGFEIQIEGVDKIQNLSEVDEFVYVRRSTVLTRYVFKRKK